jgi:MoxR-like ATPase
LEKIVIDGVELTLMPAVKTDDEWIDYGEYLRQLQAAWLTLSNVEPPLNPRLIGEPGVGKTTLACAVARELKQDVYIFQCTMDTRPEDLVITPVVTGDKRIEYRASSVVSAVISGGILVLDEGNRMPEKTWASLTPLLDGRRYIDSSIASIRIRAQPRFHICVTMNDDSSV